MKTNTSKENRRFLRTFVVVGILAFCLAGFTALSPLFGGETPAQPRNLKQWLTTLTDLQRQQFNRLVTDHFSSFLHRKENFIPNEKGYTQEFLEDLKQLLPADQYQSFRNLLKPQTDRLGTSELQLSGVKSTCGDCYWVEYWVDHGVGYIQDAQTIYNNSDHYCTPTPWGVPMQPVEAGLFLANLYGNNAKDNFWEAYSTCDCASAQQALLDLQDAIEATQNTIDDTDYWCDPNAPWLDMLNSALQMFNNALQSAQDCVDQACGT